MSASGQSASIKTRNSPSEEMDAPDRRKSLSPICIGKTFRAGKAIVAPGSVAVRFLPVPASPAVGRLSVAEVPLRALCERVPIVGASGPVEGPDSSPVSDIAKDTRRSFGSDGAPAGLLSEVDLRFTPATVGGAVDGCRRSVELSAWGVLVTADERV